MSSPEESSERTATMDDVLLYLKSMERTMNEQISALNRTVFQNKENFPVEVHAQSVETPIVADSDMSRNRAPPSRIFERANFRHETSTHLHDVPRSGSIPLSNLHSRRFSYEDQSRLDDQPSWFQKRLSNLSLQDKSFNTNNNVIRSIVPIDPSTCQVQLTHISFESVYNWSQQMWNLQQRFIYEELQWGQFISEKIVHVLFAYDEVKQITGGKSIIIGKYIGLTNPLLFHLVCSLVMPKNEEDWRTNFTKLVVFNKVPPNIHIVDTTYWDFWYMAFLMYCHKSLEVADLLNSDPVKQHQHVLKSTTISVGLMELFFSAIPLGVGKTLHRSLNQQQVKFCRSFREYLLLLKSESQSLMDASDLAKENRRKHENKSLLNSDNEFNTKVNKVGFTTNNVANKFAPSNPYNKSFNTNSKLHMMSLNDDNTRDYPNSDTRNNLQQQHLFNPYTKDYNYDNKYNPDTDERMSDFDYFDSNFDKPISDHNGLNPAYKEDILYSLDRSKVPLDPQKMKLLPCYNKLRDICQSSAAACQYSHDDRILRKEWDIRNKELSASPYAPRNSSNHTPHPTHMQSDNFGSKFKPRSILSKVPEQRRLFEMEESSPSEGMVSNTKESSNPSLFDIYNSGVFSPYAGDSQDIQELGVNGGNFNS